MSNVVTGPKGPHRANTGISGGAIVRGRAIKRGADANTFVAATANSVNAGIAVDDQDTTGRTFPFVDQPGEIVEGRVGAAVALDAYLTSDADGSLVTATVGQNIVAQALQAATAANQLIPVKLFPTRTIAP